MPSRLPPPRRPMRPPPLRWLGALLVLCALAVRVAVPAGWMPAASGPGADGLRFAITICDGTGGEIRTLTIPRTLPGQHAPAPQDAPGSAHAACPFAAVALATLAGAAPTLAPPPPPVPATLPAERTPAPPPASDRWRPPGRAPPALA